MRRALWATAALFWAASICGRVLSQPPDGPPRRPDPQQIFQRLDANDDGQITRDEVPQQAPERIKQLLRRADANQDEVVTAEEFKKAFAAIAARFGPPDRPLAAEGRPPVGARPPAGPLRAARPDKPTRAQREPEQERPPLPAEAKRPSPPRASGRARGGPRGPHARGLQVGRSFPEGPRPGEFGRYGPGPRLDVWGQFHWRGGPLPPAFGFGRLGPPPWALRRHAGPAPATGRGVASPYQRGPVRPSPGYVGPRAGVGPRALPDPKVIFARLDRDNDGKLSEAEFAAGMRMFHAIRLGRGAGRPGGPQPPSAGRAGAAGHGGPPAVRPGPRRGGPPDVGPRRPGPRDRGPRADQKRGGPREEKKEAQSAD